MVARWSLPGTSSRVLTGRLFGGLSPRYRRLRRGEDRHGFTLVELVVVIVVIALLLGLAAFGYTRFVAGARTASAEALAVQVGKAVQAHSATAQLAYSQMNYPKVTVESIVDGDLPEGAGVSGMEDRVDDDTGAETSTITVTYQDRPASVVFRTGQVGGPATTTYFGGDAGGTSPPPGPSPVSSYVEEVLTDAPLAYYRLGDSSGTDLVDFSGNDRNGAFPTGPTWGAAGALAGDLDTALTGGAGHATVPYGPWLDTGSALSVEAWVRTAATTGYLFTRETGGNPFSLDLTNGFPRFMVRWGGSSSNANATSAIAVNDGQWHHLVGTWNGEQIRLYVDGSLAGIRDTGPHTLWSNPVGLSVGGWNGGSFVAGDLDEVALYGAVLTPERVRAHHQAGNPTPWPATPAGSYGAVVAGDNPLAHYPLSDAGHGQMLEVSGNSRHGSYTAGTELSQPPLIAGTPSMRVDTAPEGGQVPYAAWMSPTEAVTAEAWINVDGGEASAGTHLIVAGRSSVAAADGNFKSWALMVGRPGTVSAGDVVFQIYRNNTSANSIAMSVPGLYTYGETAHLVGTYDGHSVRVYLNGELVARNVFPGTVNPGNRPLLIGSSDTSHYRLRGRIGHFAFYDTALSVEQVRRHYLAGLAVLD